MTSQLKLMGTDLSLTRQIIYSAVTSDFYAAVRGGRFNVAIFIAVCLLFWQGKTEAVKDVA